MNLLHITTNPSRHPRSEAISDPFLDLIAEYADHTLAFPGEEDAAKEADWHGHAADLFAKLRETTPLTVAGAVAGVAFVRDELIDCVSCSGHVDILDRCLSALRGEA